MKKSILRHGLAVLAMLTIGACATTPGQFNGLGNDVMGMLVVYRTDDQPLAKAEYDAVVKVAKKMGARVGLQLSSPFEAAVTSGMAQAAAGALDTAAGAFGIVGVIEGLTAYSYAMVHVVGEATENALRDRENAGESIFHVIHVSSAFVRSRNNETVPAASASGPPMQ